MLLRGQLLLAGVVKHEELLGQYLELRVTDGTELHLHVRTREGIQVRKGFSGEKLRKDAELYRMSRVDAATQFHFSSRRSRTNVLFSGLFGSWHESSEKWESPVFFTPEISC